MKKHRYLYLEIAKALSQKMVFLAGPRQVGKTTLSINLVGDKANETSKAYLNWDNPKHAKLIKNLELPDEPLVIFDEIHKYAKWRNLIKGIFDTEKSFRKILVTGSARLDYYRKGGDSLLGRYRFFRLHPFSLLEYNEKPTSQDTNILLKFGGFPEPLFEKDETALRIWQRDRITRVIREDLRDLENVREISLLENLADLLPLKVGSVLSVKSIREDLMVDHKTAERWIQILENLYVCFRIPPYGTPKIRAVKKEQKLYLWDWSVIETEGARFENLVASQLLKYCHWQEDTKGHRMELRFIRDFEKREIDFVVLKDKKPEFAVECKTGEKGISPALDYFAARLPIPRFFQVHRGKKSFVKGNIKVLPFEEFCISMQMP